MEIFYRTLEIINYICCAISTVLFAIQLIYILFIWLPPKHFKESTNYHKMAVLIVARNESDVIGETVKSLLDQQTYPKDRFDVFVCADNCTDDTEAKAKAAGAITYTHSDPDPAHHRAAFPVQYAMKERGQGYILNVASTAAFQPGPNLAVYYASKAFVESFTEAIAEENRGTGLRISTFCPGPVDTPFLKKAGMDTSKVVEVFKPQDPVKLAEIAYKALMKGTVVIVPGAKNRRRLFATRLFSRARIRKMMAKITAPKK